MSTSMLLKPEQIEKSLLRNQLEDTNHDHLGKLITYASGKSADVVIWIVKLAREEHRSAIEWLNNHTDANIAFFLLEIKLYQIGDSDIAVKFVVIEKPNDWTKEIKRQISSSPTLQDRLEFWMAFNEYAFAKQMTKALKKMFEANPITCFEKLTDKSAIATLNTTQSRFADDGYRFYEFIRDGILHTLEINQAVNFNWLFTMKIDGKTEYVYAGEKFKEIVLERYGKD